MAINPPTPEETPGERLTNTLSSALGVLIMIGAAPVLFSAARRSGHPWALTGAAVFIASVIALYLASTFYHAVPPGRAKGFLRLCDHSGIFLAIAGTYTPFALGPLASNGGETLLFCEWALAALGIVFKFTGGIRYSRLSNIVYLAMGWLGLFWIRPFVHNVPSAVAWWILAGGVAYTAGVVFYVAKHRRYAHFVWHIFVLAGTCCHCVAVFKCVA